MPGLFSSATLQRPVDDPRRIRMMVMEHDSLSALIAGGSNFIRSISLFPRQEIQPSRRDHVIKMYRYLVSLLLVLFVSLCALPAYAVTGNAPPANGWAARPLVMVIDDRGDLCTGTALTLDLVLTAAHCVTRSAGYEVRLYQNGREVPVHAIVRHPGFDAGAYRASRATADIALLKLATGLGETVVPAALAPPRRVAVGEAIVIAGFGVTEAGTSRGLRIPREAKLVVTGQPGSLQVRLVDPEVRGERIGLGACTGDSGAPAFDGEGPSVIGVVGWSTAPHDNQGCGGLTGLIPLLKYREWIIHAARQLGSPLKE